MQHALTIFSRWLLSYHGRSHSCFGNCMENSYHWNPECGIYTEKSAFVNAPDGVFRYRLGSIRCWPSLPWAITGSSWPKTHHQLLYV